MSNRECSPPSEKRVKLENSQSRFCSDAKKIIKKNYDELTHLSVDSLLGKLFTKEVITLKEKKMIGTLLLSSQKMEYLLDNIIMPSLDANVTVKFQEFLEVMAESDDLALTDMAKKLELTIASSTIVPPQLNYHMKEYQEFLKEKYDSLELSSPREMLDCYSTEYVNLTLTGKEEGDNYYFMFHKDVNNDNVPLTEALDVEGYKKKVILILGGPGMGKSTLAINICKQWANGELLQGYDAVILLQLRFKKIQKAEYIQELLLTPNDELKEKVYSEIAKSNGKKICFILEGYDELPYDLQRFSVFTELTEELIKCTVICTSRPEAYLPLFTNAIKIIKINGFNKESVDIYISKAFEKFRNGGEMTNQLKSQIRNNPLVRSILHIPINLAIVCLIFSHLSELPKTLTKLYTLLCLRLILRHINTRTNIKQVEKLHSLDELPKDIAKQFSQLCYIAYKGIEAEMIIQQFS